MTALQNIPRALLMTMLAVKFSLNVVSGNQINSFFELRSLTALLSSDMSTDQVETENLIGCAMRCLATQMCTACSYEKHRGVCKISRVPKNKLLFKNDSSIDTLVMKPCFGSPNLCKNGGTCIQKSDSEGYNCMCGVGWEGYHCESQVDRCPWEGFTYYESTKLCYSPNNEQVDYLTAVERCREKNATLAIGSSPRTIETILNIAKSRNQWMIVGLVKKDGTWRWLDNSTAYIQWRLQGEPSGDGNCANTFRDGNGLNDMPCEFPRSYLCQRKNIFHA